jgi:hypothetical protein
MPERIPGRGMSIERRGKSKWLIRIYMGRDPVTKKRLGISEIFNGTEDEAREREKDLKAELRLGILKPPSRMTLNDLIDLYLNANKHKASLATFEKNVTQLKLWVQPKLGHLRLDKLDEIVLQAHFVYLLAPKDEEEEES